MSVLFVEYLLKMLFSIKYKKRQSQTFSGLPLTVDKVFCINQRLAWLTYILTLKIAFFMASGFSAATPVRWPSLG